MICSNLCLSCFAKFDTIYDVAVFYLKFHVMLCSVAIAHMYLHNGLFFSRNLASHSHLNNKVSASAFSNT